MAVDGKGGLDKADRKFVEEMIVHHKAAISMANEYLGSTDPETRSPEIEKWAQEIAAGQADEIRKATGWLGGKSSGLKGDAMPEMKKGKLGQWE